MRVVPGVLVVLLALVPVHAEEAGPRCVHGAWVDVEAGAHAAYEGLRLGLERARLDRVCAEPAPADEAAAAARTRAWQATLDKARAGKEEAPWLFAFGDASVARLARDLPAAPAVFVLVRYAVGGEWLVPDPAPDDPRPRVVAAVEAVEVGAALRDWLRIERPRVAWMGSGPDARVARFLAAAGLERVAPTEADAVLHLALDGTIRAPLDPALAAALEARVLLASDDRAAFGAGAPLVLVPDHELLGRVAANLARTIHHPEPEAPPPPSVRTVRGLARWVDLEAVDRLGLAPSLAVLAGADRLRPGRRR